MNADEYVISSRIPMEMKVNLDKKIDGRIYKTRNDVIKAAVQFFLDNVPDGANNKVQ